MMLYLAVMHRTDIYHGYYIPCCEEMKSHFGIQNDFAVNLAFDEYMSDMFREAFSRPG